MDIFSFMANHGKFEESKVDEKSKDQKPINEADPIGLFEYVVKSNRPRFGNQINEQPINGKFNRTKDFDIKESVSATNEDFDPKAEYKHLRGEYSKLGYNIIGVRPDGTEDEIYHAGNSPFDSSDTMSPNDPDALGIDIMKDYCNSTGEEMATKNYGVEWKGCEEVEKEWPGSNEGKIANDKDKESGRVKYAVIKSEKYGGMRELKRFDDEKSANDYAEEARRRLSMGPGDVISVEKIKVDNSCPEGKIANDKDKESEKIKKLTEIDKPEPDEDEPAPDVGDTIQPDKVAAGEEPKEAPEITKEYLGNTEDNHYYLVSTEDGQDLQVVDQEGVMKFSAKDHNIEPTDVVELLKVSIPELEIEVITRSVFMKYIMPALEEEEKEEEEIPDEELDKERPEKEKELEVEEPEKEEPIEGKIANDKDKESEKIKKLTEMIVNDGKHDFDVYLMDDGSLDTVISINGQEFRFDAEFAANWRDESGELSEEGLEELALDALSNIEPEEYEELVAAGVEEPETPDEDMKKELEQESPYHLHGDELKRAEDAAKRGEGQYKKESKDSTENNEMKDQDTKNKKDEVNEVKGMVRISLMACDWKENFTGKEVARAIRVVGGEQNLYTYDQDTVDSKVMFVSSIDLTDEQLDRLWTVGDLVTGDKEYWEGKDFEDIVKQIENYVEKEYKGIPECKKFEDFIHDNELQNQLDDVYDSEDEDALDEKKLVGKGGRKLKAGAKRRHRGKVVFSWDSPKVKDKKDHFPINDEGQARNALGRAGQYKSSPKWYSGSLESLKNAVKRAVKKAYPKIKVSESKDQNVPEKNAEVKDPKTVADAKVNDKPAANELKDSRGLAIARKMLGM